MKLIVGLGNPGKQYELTRHNVGFLCLDELEKRLNLNFKLNKEMQALEATLNYQGEKVIFIKPQTFMNLSGDSVIKYVKYYKVMIDDVLVIYDDMDLPLGSLRLREKGSAGGHNGIKSIIANLSTQEFKRIRVGISGHLNIEAKDYVLGRFSKEEQATLNVVRSIVGDAVIDFLNNLPYTIIMGSYNGQKV